VAIFGDSPRQTFIEEIKHLIKYVTGNARKTIKHTRTKREDWFPKEDEDDEGGQSDEGGGR
jgi:hypothetical protein